MNTNQPMTPTPTPRTDAEEIVWNDIGWSAGMIELARDLERELEQERQDRKQADLDCLRALGERNDMRAEIAVWKHEAKRLEAELEKFDETAISWWCEYQDLKAKARQP